MTIMLPQIDSLIPVKDQGIYLFPSDTTDLVKIDLLFEAGSAYQHKKLCAAATVKLMCTATKAMDSAALAEFMDYRGIVVEADSQVQQTSLTFYLLRRYAEELLPIVRDIVYSPAFNEDDFEVWRNHRRQEILSAEQKPSTIARREFYLQIFGEHHPLGSYATAADLDNLTLDDIRTHHTERYVNGKVSVVLAGAVDDNLVDMVHAIFATTDEDSTRKMLPFPERQSITTRHIAMSSATQTTVRVGRLLPLSWDSAEYTRFMLLTTALGGYFSSRLMQNLREDKGLTYGIYARTQIYRGLIVFYITADISGGSAQMAVAEIKNELSRLCNETIPNEELQLVKTVMAGDFLRSVDGIFERSARFCDMYATCVDEQLTVNLQRALEETTPEQIKKLAAEYLQPESMIVCTAGV